MFLPPSVCLCVRLFVFLFVCLFVRLSVNAISQKRPQIFQFCFTAEVPHTRGRTLLNLEIDKFKMAAPPQHMYETYFCPYVSTALRY